MTWPFALFKTWFNEGNDYMEVLLEFLGIKDDESGLRQRFLSVLLIAIGENILQFIVSFSEIFIFKTTITFV